MPLWFEEKHWGGTSLRLKVRQVLFHEHTGLQDLAIIDTEDFGRALVLDGVLQTTERDEAFYHEMLAHVPLCAHPAPRRVLVIGGGDGGLVREVLRHPGVEHVTMVEIDRQVVEACRRYLPAMSSTLADPRVRLLFQDGVQYVRECQGSFDCILVDSTDPSGPSLGLFTPAFYADCFRILSPQGFLACQTEEPFFRAEAMRQAFRAVAAVFPLTRLYLSMVPVYSVWFWTFTVGSKGSLDPAELRSPPPPGTRYYCPEIHRAAFVLPPFLRDQL